MEIFYKDYAFLTLENRSKEIRLCQDYRNNILDLYVEYSKDAVT